MLTQPPLGQTFQPPPPWQFFHAVEWRNLSFEGEVIGEGRWFYASGLAMKQSPFSQARRNR